MLKRSITATTVLSIVMLGILFFTTAPSSAGPLGILVFFVFMYLAALGVLTFLFRFLNLLADKFLPKVQHNKLSSKGASFQKAYYYASVLALVPVMVVAMQSVGQVGFYQVLLVVFFAIVAWMYVKNRTS